MSKRCTECDEVCEDAQLVQGKCQACRWAAEACCRECGTPVPTREDIYCGGCMDAGEDDMRVHALREEGKL